MILVIGLSSFLRALLWGSAAIALANLALRHQLLVLQRSVGRPRLSRWDRIFWVWLSRLWASWRSSLVIVQPATVLAWHRQGFQLYWRWKSRPNPVGRPRLDAELRDLIRRMVRENPTWGRRRIQAKLALLGSDVAELTVAKYMHRASPRPSPTWRAFLAAHTRSEAHLRRLLRAYLAYYNTVRPHQALENNSPRPRDAQPPALGGVIAIPQVGGLHHHYQRAA